MQKKTTLRIDRKNNYSRPRPSSSESELQDIIDSLEDELMVIDRNFRITQVNKAVLNKHLTRNSEVIGKHCYEISHGLRQPCRPPVCECPVVRVWETEKPVNVTHIHSFDTGDGNEERYLNVIATPLRDSYGHITKVIEMIRDVTEERRLQRQIVETNQHLLVLNSIATTVSQSMNLDTILNSALDNLLKFMEGTVAGILFMDNSQTFSHYIYRGLPEEFSKEVSGMKLGEDQDVRKAQRQVPFFIDDISNDSRFNRSAVPEGIRSFASVPLQSKNKFLGTMYIANHTQQRFSSRDAKFLSIVANQIAIAVENATLYNDLLHKEEIHRELLGMIVSIQEEERKRIARGLHDETSQTLTSLAVKLEVLIDSQPMEINEIKTNLKRMQSLTLNTLDEIQRVIYELRPTLLDDLGLVAAVQWFIKDYLEIAGINVHLDVKGKEVRLPVQIETALFRIVQEASNNIVKHAHADATSISLNFSKNSIAICIEDSGVGFDLDTVTISRGQRRGLGLVGMQERVGFLGGILTIDSRPGQGTRISAEIPIHQEINYDQEDKSADSR